MSVPTIDEARKLQARENTDASCTICGRGIYFRIPSLPNDANAQEMPGMQQMTPGQSQHTHGEMQPVQAVYPRMGRAQESAKSALFTLEEAQRVATESNPTLQQAEAEIRASKARQLQAGLYPNPTVGYVGDEIRGGSVNGGKQGFFVQQNIVTGGKLPKSRDVFSHETRIAETEAQEQKLRVESAVKTAFLRVLAAQELLDTKKDLAAIESNYADTQRRHFNTGQADETELLEAEVDAQRQRVAARMQENTLREEWRSLAAVMGKPDMLPTIVSGDLEHGWPELNEEQIVESIATQSPATRIADASSQRATAQILRGKRESIPDLLLRGGLIYNREPLHIENSVTGLGRHRRNRRAVTNLQSQSGQCFRSHGRSRSRRTRKATHRANPA